MLLSHGLSALYRSNRSHQWFPILSPPSILIAIRAMDLIMISNHAILLLLILKSSLPISFLEHLNILNLLNAFLFTCNELIN
jgi:hypothetical protein